MDRKDASTITGFERGLAGIPHVRHAERLFGDSYYLVRVTTADLASQALRDEEPAGFDPLGLLAAGPTWRLSWRLQIGKRPNLTAHDIIQPSNDRVLPGHRGLKYLRHLRQRGAGSSLLDASSLTGPVRGSYEKRRAGRPSRAVRRTVGTGPGTGCQSPRVRQEFVVVEPAG